MSEKNTDYFAQAQAQMEAWGEEIRKLQTKMMEAGAAGQDQMMKQIEALNDQRKNAENHLENLGKANMDAWKEMRANMEKAWKDMEKAMEDARKKFMG